jgi:hypothetical protein
MNPNLEFEKGIEALRCEQPEPGAALRTLTALRQPLKKRSWPVRVSATAAVIAIGLFVFLPQPSAASSLDPIVQALQAAPKWMRTTYTRDPLGNETWSSVTVHLGAIERTTFNPDAPEASPQGELSITTIDGKRIRKFANREVVESQNPSSDPSPAQVIVSMASHELVQSVKVSRNVVEDGRRFDKYLVMWRADEVQRAGQLTIYTEPGSKLPVRMIGISGNSIGFHTEWAYRDFPARFSPR